jgi:amphi-Trp domain-containing protein
MIPARFRGRARRDAAAFYLSQLGKAILDGELDVQNGEQSTTLATAEFVLMKIEIKQKKRTNHVDIKLRWPRRPLIRVEPYPRRTT